MTAGIALAAVGAMALAVLILVCVLLARLGGYWGQARKGSEPSGFSTGGFSIERYEPLSRLLADRDSAFLRQQSRCPEIAARWNHSRRRIIRMYLRDLTADFRRLHADARAMVAESPEQDAELVNVLMRQQLVFCRQMLAVELWLTASWLGIGRLSADRLVEAIAAMQVEIARTIAPLPAQA
jgi:hypothetical protein